MFSIYSNKIYRLFEYEFTDINDYSSIKLIKNKNYSLQDTEITLEELIEVSNETRVKYTEADFFILFKFQIPPVK